jgi:ABC-type branched-subunit amino acid transport system substrate-binding protein
MDELGLSGLRQKIVANHVGVILPLSGNLKGVGQAVLRGIRLGLGPKTVLVVRDSAGRSDNIENHILDLEAEGVIGIIGPINRRGASVAGRLADERQIPIIRLSVEASLPQARQWAFRAFLSLRSQCKALVNYAHRRGLKRWAILHADSALGKGLTQNCQNEITLADGKVVVTQSYPANATSLTELAKTLKESKFNALFVADIGQRAGLVLRFLAREDIWTIGALQTTSPESEVQYVQFFAPMEWKRPELITQDARYAKGIVIAAEWPGADTRPAAELNAAFQSEFGREPGVFHAIGYDAIRMIQAAGARSRRGLMKRLHSEQGFDGVLGHTRFDEKGEVNREVHLYRVGSKGFKAVGIRRDRKTRN